MSAFDEFLARVDHELTAIRGVRVLVFHPGPAAPNRRVSALAPYGFVHEPFVRGSVRPLR